MPGLAKVGKTTRDPSDRVAELSAATGVPTPFILAYSQPVSDCHFVERWVHSELGERGYRRSEDREFFTAPLHEIVQIVSQAAIISTPLPPEAGHVEEEEVEAVGTTAQLNRSGFSGDLLV